MKSRSGPVRTIVLFSAGAACLGVGCIQRSTEPLDFDLSGRFTRVAEFTPSPDVPHDVTTGTTPYPTVSLTQLATFAWHEFVALNYPADPNHRGKPKPDSELGDKAEARVWETYWHKVEMFPYDQKPAQKAGKPVVTGKPTYKYDPAAFSFSGSFGGTGKPPKPDLWNNLDENNELNVDQMFAHVSIVKGDPKGFDPENRVLYEAKMNEVGFAYILDKKLYVTKTRDKFVAASSTPHNLETYAGKCGVTQADIVSLPCGQIGGSEGNIEIKAAWRRLTDAERKSGKFYVNEVMRYQAIDGKRQWFVDEYGLVGLHIIHKTVNFPSFVYATFEHVDNIASGIGYIDEITQKGRGTGDAAGKKVIIGARDNPIPAEIAAVNETVRKAIGGTVWSNYELVGVQAQPVDFSELGSTTADKSTYYLANLMIESNEELQNFRGKKPGADKDSDNMYYLGKPINMGGCMGCHGVAQLVGADFNFLIKNSPFASPEIVGDSGVISFRKIESYADVQKMFDDYVKLNGIQIQSSPHHAFWSTLTYEQFTTGNVPNVGIRIVIPGKPEDSAIVQILEGTFQGIPEMPAGGPYFPEEQVKEFAQWVKNKCPK